MLLMYFCANSSRNTVQEEANRSKVNDIYRTLATKINSLGMTIVEAAESVIDGQPHRVHFAPPETERQHVCRLRVNTDSVDKLTKALHAPVA